MSTSFTKVDRCDDRPHALKARIEALEYEVEELKKAVQTGSNHGGAPVYGTKEIS